MEKYLTAVFLPTNQHLDAQNNAQTLSFHVCVCSWRRGYLCSYVSSRYGSAGEDATNVYIALCLVHKPVVGRGQKVVCP